MPKQRGKEEQKKMRLYEDQAPDRSKITNYIKDETMLKILAQKGINKLFPIQYETFDYILNGEDLVAKDRTGSGKTLAFSLPVITRMRKQSMFSGYPFPKFLIMLPTRYSNQYS